jgi:four helix bundle protein
MGIERNGDHRNLVVWQKAMRLAAEVYRATVAFPRNEIFGLTSQIRRAAVSIPSNLAAGSARRTTPEFISFLYIARGSQAELDSQLRLAHEIGYLSADARPDSPLSGHTPLSAILYPLPKTARPAARSTPSPRPPPR